VRQNKGDSRFVHHTLQANDLGATVTAMAFGMDGLLTGGETITVNPGAPRAMRLNRIFVHSSCAIVNTPGDWTVRIRVNGSGSDSATFVVGNTAVPGTKLAGQMSTDIVLQAGDTYNLLADGPSRNIAFMRAVLEWEVL
jgi:hypothetical protein